MRAEVACDRADAMTRIAPARARAAHRVERGALLAGGLAFAQRRLLYTVAPVGVGARRLVAGHHAPLCMRMRPSVGRRSSLRSQ